jgi:hypothetical protein
MSTGDPGEVDPEGSVVFAKTDESMTDRISDAFDPVMCGCRDAFRSTVFNLYVVSNQKPCGRCGSVLVAECHACHQFACLGCALTSTLERREKLGTPLLYQGKSAKDLLAETRLEEHMKRHTGEA